MIGMFGLDDACVVDAQEELSAGERRALRDQRLRERLRLAAGLSGDNAVARTDEASQIERVGCHGGDANICIRQIPRRRRC